MAFSVPKVFRRRICFCAEVALLLEHIVLFHVEDWFFHSFFLFLPRLNAAMDIEIVPHCVP